MKKAKPTTNSQWLEIARMARERENPVPRQALQAIIADPKSADDFFQSLMPNILWQNGPHKVVKNDDGTVSAWIDCNQIDWEQSNQEVIDATGRRPYVTKSMVDTMPKGEVLSGVVEIVFRNFGRTLSDQNLADEFASDEPMTSPFLSAKIDELFPELADTYPNGVNWKDVDGKWCYEAFNRWYGERHVDVDRHDGGWGGRWWFPRLRKL